MKVPARLSATEIITMWRSYATNTFPSVLLDVNDGYRFIRRTGKQHRYDRQQRLSLTGSAGRTAWIFLATANALLPDYARVYIRDDHNAIDYMDSCYESIRMCATEFDCDVHFCNWRVWIGNPTLIESARSYLR